MSPGEPPALPWIVPGMLSDQACIQIWGSHRAAVNRAAWELGSRMSSEYRWVQVGDPEEKLDPDDPIAGRLVPPSHLFRTVPPEEMVHDRAAANLGMWAVVREHDSNPAHHPLIDFLRLPGVAQEILGSSPVWGSRPVCVIANADRVARSYPDEALDIRALLGVWRREGMSLITTFTGVKRKSRFEYDYAFELRVERAADWRKAKITCEKDRDKTSRRIGVPVPAFPLSQP